MSQKQKKKKKKKKKIVMPGSIVMNEMFLGKYSAVPFILTRYNFLLCKLKIHPEKSFENVKKKKNCHLTI